ncbi:hemerythrin domain-containing protein [Celeribacter neptunius]|uniref:hemerythrin domain-containing protein n=1 Tax=Celeribacter neptunius TaxID=588602 RepID=UPI001FEBD1E0|nr:hemerythrin domain-containing protein [Celeribacter neptunius]
MPEEMQLLLRDYPRDTWPDHPNFTRSVQKWMSAHDMFRALSSYLREDTEAFLDKRMEDQIYAQKLAKYGHILLQSLHGHHTWEDRRFFPELGHAESRLIAGLDMLETDHEALDGTLETFKRGANRIVQLAHLSPADMYDEAGAIHAHVDKIGSILDRHLADEEDLVVPIILHHKLRG